MMKRIFREITVKPSSPGSYRASSLAWWFWCAEQAYWKCQGIEDESVNVEAKRIGTLVHELIHKEKKAWTWELKFLEELEKRRLDNYGFVRKLEGNEIYEDVTGHPDEFQITPAKKVSIIELKTTSIKPTSSTLNFYIRYRLPVAQFQTQIYCWILEPIIKELGYELERVHAVSVYHVEYEGGELKNYKHWMDIPVFYYPMDVYKQIKDILFAFKNPLNIIPPRGFPFGFKCRNCPKIYKERCRFMKKEEKKG